MATSSIQNTDLQSFLAIKTEIAEFANKYGSLSIAGLDDKAGLERVHAARMLVKNKRIEVEKRGKELREDAVKTQKTVLAAVKELVGLMEPVETHLKSEEDKIEKLKEEIRQEAVRKEEEKLQGRVAQLTKLGIVPNLAALKNISDVDFADYLQVQKQQHEAKLQQEAEERKTREEAQRIEAEKRQKEDAERRKQQEELRIERERLAEIQRKQDAESAKIAAEKKRLADEEAKRLEALKPKAVPVAHVAQSVQPKQDIPVVEEQKPVPVYPPKVSAAMMQRGSLLAFAESIKDVEFPECSDDLKAEIRQLLENCSEEIADAVIEWFSVNTKQEPVGASVSAASSEFSMDDF